MKILSPDRLRPKDKIRLLSLLCFFLIVSSTAAQPAGAAAQTVKVPEGFYLAGIIEETRAVEAGTIATVRSFLQKSFSKDRSLRPLIITIKELQLTETTTADHRTRGTLTLSLSFGLQKDYGTALLTEYKGKLQYTSSKPNVPLPESSLQNLLGSGITYFNNWISINTGSSQKLARQVKITFTDYTEKPEGDTIYYAANRPLRWADFQSRIKPMSRYQALVMPGIAYDQQANLVKDTILVKITLKAFLPKSASWANYTGRDDYTLNHEQRHFDITKIISQDFKRRLQVQKLTPDNYEAIINMQYLDSLRDLDAMQKQYDGETAHGTNFAAQSAWNSRIDSELKKQLAL